MKNKIIIIIILLLMLFVGSLTFYKISMDKEDNSQPDKSTNVEDSPITFDEELDTILQKINVIYSEYINGSIDVDDSYFNENLQRQCYKYTGERQNEISKYLLDVFNNPFYSTSPFQITLKEDNTLDKLYFCRKENCQQQIYSLDDYEIIEETENQKNIKLGSLNVDIKYIDKSWKFEFPLLTCKVE